MPPAESSAGLIRSVFVLILDRDVDVLRHHAKAHYGRTQAQERH